MSNIITSDELVIEKDGKRWTTSILVAEKFDKEHKHVLEAIRNAHCSDIFKRSNFRPQSYKNLRGVDEPMVLMTEKGFSWIALGFNGERAAQWKEQFLDAFEKSYKPMSNLEMLSMSIKIAQEHENRLNRQDQKMNTVEAKIEAIELKIKSERVNEFPNGCSRIADIADKLYPFISHAVVARWLHINKHPMSEYKHTTEDGEVRSTPVYQEIGLKELSDKLRLESVFVKDCKKNQKYFHPLLGSNFMVKKVSHISPFKMNNGGPN